MTQSLPETKHLIPSPSFGARYAGVSTNMFIDAPPPALSIASDYVKTDRQLLFRQPRSAPPELNAPSPSSVTTGNGVRRDQIINQPQAKKRRSECRELSLQLQTQRFQTDFRVLRCPVLLFVHEYVDFINRFSSESAFCSSVLKNLLSDLT